MREAQNPYRIIHQIGKNDILLQDGEEKLTITKSRQSKKAASKCSTLWEGCAEDFCTEFKVMEEHGQMNIKKAFINFISTL